MAQKEGGFQPPPPQHLDVGGEEPPNDNQLNLCINRNVGVGSSNDIQDLPSASGNPPYGGHGDLPILHDSRNRSVWTSKPSPVKNSRVAITASEHSAVFKANFKGLEGQCIHHFHADAWAMCTV